MAKIITQTVSVTLSKLVGNKDLEFAPLISEDTAASLEAIVGELVGDRAGIIVEVEVKESVITH